MLDGVSAAGWAADFRMTVGTTAWQATGVRRGREKQTTHYARLADPFESDVEKKV
jgi:hypothetical protein